MTEQTDFYSQAGQRIIDQLHLKQNKKTGRVDTSYGTKTAYGLWLSLQKMQEDIVKERTQAFTISLRRFPKVKITLDGNGIHSNLKRQATTAKEADVIETLLLAMHCEGIDLASSAIEKALTTTLETLANQ